MALPLLISRRKGDIILPTDYKLGWLYKDDKEGYWQVWGSSKDKETALKCAKDVIEKQGERDILISDEPIPINLTTEQINKFRKF
jgi:hypothetical protein